MVLDGVVITSPSIAPGVLITDGKVEVSGEASGGGAAVLAGELMLGTLGATFQIDDAGAAG